MKKLFFLSFISFLTLTVSAQNDEPQTRTFHRPDYEGVQSIGKPAYEALLKRFYAADTTLTLEEMQNIYFGSAFYGYLSGDFNEDKIMEMLKNNENPKKIAKILDVYLKTSPVDIRALLYRAAVAGREMNEEARAKFANMFIRLCDAILQTGSGLTEKTAWHVVSVDDEYTIIWHLLEAQTEGQVLTSNLCDKITISTEYGIPVDVYFDVQLVLAIERRALYGGDESFHFTYEEKTGESTPIAGLNIGGEGIDIIEIDDTVEESEELQTPLMDEEGNYLTPDIMPEFPGGQKALFDFLSANVDYPKECVDAGIQGKVILQFVVDMDGSITDVQVVRTAGHPLLDKEAIRVVKSMPKWIPGINKNKIVPVRFTLPINFKLEDSHPAE